jgi:hypothetical protein
VSAYIASLPPPQRRIAERIDALAARTLPDRRELDREWQPVQLAADLRHNRRVGIAQLEAIQDRRRALDEIRNCAKSFATFYIAPEPCWRSSSLRDQRCV